MLKLETDFQPKLLSSDRALEKKKRSLEENRNSSKKKKKKRTKLVEEPNCSSGGGSNGESHSVPSTDYSPKVPPLKIVFSNVGGDDGGHSDHEALVVGRGPVDDDQEQILSLNRKLNFYLK